ncbi:MAG: thioether cross-link-forming SCIFF peptide maturase [Oscillospiraceae bacterium]|nr:thioether cross-link-forming SCIFF peptide maturase [Oscillospiraceae bacterium]
MIHKYELLGRYIVLDVSSGAVHQVDKTTYALLDQITPPMAPAPPGGLSDAEREAWAELYALQEEGLLFTEDAPVPDAPETPLKALCLHVAHDCNLRCGYCFASTGDFGAERKLMSPETGERAIDYLLARCGPRRNLEIDFFGGEPLMAMDTVRHVVRYARDRAPDKHFRFTLTTNGLLLDEDTIAFLNREMNNVVLSLDGRPGVNDAMRKTVSGEGSYRLVVPKFKRLLASRAGDYFVRGTFTAKNLDFLSDIEQLEREGFENISLEPAVLPPGHPLALTEEHLPFLLREYERLLESMLQGQGYNFFHFQLDLEQGPCVYKRVRGCGAGYEYAAVTPDGDLYPCHQFAGRPEFRLGSVREDTPLDGPVSGQFRSLSIDTLADCRACWARYYCSGGCAASNLTAEGSLGRCYALGCELERKRVECAILLKAASFEGQ